MSRAHVLSPIDESDYLRRKVTATSKHELVGGEIHAMAGASERHSRTDNTFLHLRNVTRGQPCRAFMADMKPRLAASTTYYYPDAMPVCDAADNRIDVTCDGTRLTLDDLYEDTGLLVV
jgi:hypothetical protein